MKGILIYIGVATPVTVLLFLGLSGFFSSWNGRVASVFPPPSPEATVRRVLVVDQDDDRFELSWQPEWLEGLDVPVDPLGIPPTDLATRPATQKLRYSLEFRVEQPADGNDAPVWTTHPTTTPQALAVAIGAWFLGLLIRNMVVAGSPFEFSPRERHKVSQQRAAGTVEPSRRGRSQKGPPPPKRSKGRGRR